MLDQMSLRETIPAANRPSRTASTFSTAASVQVRAGSQGTGRARRRSPHAEKPPGVTVFVLGTLRTHTGAHSTATRPTPPRPLDHSSPPAPG